MSSSNRITHSKGKSEGFSIPYETIKGKEKGKSEQTNKINQLWHSSAPVLLRKVSSCNNKQLSNSHYYYLIAPGLLPLSLLQVP